MTWQVEKLLEANGQGDELVQAAVAAEARKTDFYMRESAKFEQRANEL